MSSTSMSLKDDELKELRQDNDKNHIIKFHCKHVHESNLFDDADEEQKIPDEIRIEAYQYDYEKYKGKRFLGKPIDQHDSFGLKSNFYASSAWCTINMKDMSKLQN